MKIKVLNKDGTTTPYSKLNTEDKFTVDWQMKLVSEVASYEISERDELEMWEEEYFKGRE